jgi:ribosomal-protein-alanine N-acetyltransferase
MPSDPPLPRTRAVRTGDAPELAQLLAPTLSTPWSLAQVEAELSHPAGRSWLVEAPDGSICAALLARRAADELEILQLAVAPEARRSGLGRLLVAGAAAEPGIKVLHLEVREDRAGARAFYRALEFREFGRRDGYYRDGGAALLLSRNVFSVR